MFLETDLTALPAAVRQRMHQLLTEQNAMAALQAKIRQERIARFYRVNQPRAIEGVGGLQMSVDPYWINYWRWKLGPVVVEQDAEFRAWLKKKHPVFAVKAGGTRFQLGFTGASRKFTKRYAPSPSRSKPFAPTAPSLQLTPGLS